MQALFYDLRFAIRQLRKSLGFTAVAVLTLALGIGANTAIFSVVDAVLLRPLPYRDSGRLVQVKEYMQGRGVADWVSFPNFHDWAEQNRVFEGMGAYKFELFNLTGVQQPNALLGSKVSASLFPTLRAQPLLGRNFLPEEDQPGHNHVVLLSYQTWNQLFPSDRKVIGKTLTFNNEIYTIVGVMPPGFDFPPTAPVVANLPSRKMSVWAPLGFALNQAERDSNMLGVVARLKPGITIAQARAEMEVISSRLEQQYPKQNRGFGVSLEPLLNQVVGNVRPTLWTFLGAICLVLLIACANVANLLFARSTTRQREIVLRATLGASPWRLVRQLLTESLLLAIAGGALGVLLAAGAISLLLAIGPGDFPRLAEITINGRVLAYSFVVSLLTAVIFGLAPSLGPSKTDLIKSLRGDGTRSTSTAKHVHMRNGLVILEMALSLALLIGAGLMFKSFLRLQRVDPGFQPENVLTVWTILPEPKYRESRQKVAFLEQTLQRIEVLPGVKSAGVIDDLPLTGIHGGGPFINRRPPERYVGYGCAVCLPL